MSKIISYYSVATEEEETDEKKYQEAAPIIKVPIFKNEEKKIETMDLIPPPPELPEPKEPKLQLTRNNEGVVIGIEVQCSCGETILIKMDYK